MSLPQRIANLCGVVRECLASLDAAGPDEPEVGRAFDELDAGFEELGDLATLVAAAPPSERDLVEQGLSDLARLHAVLTTNVARDRDRLCLLLEKTRAARGALKGNATGGAVESPIGTSCDMSA